MVGDEDLAVFCAVSRCLWGAQSLLGARRHSPLGDRPASSNHDRQVAVDTAPGRFVIADAATVVLAVAAVFFALATVGHGGGCRFGWSVARWPLAALMVLRAVPSAVGDVDI